MKKLFFLLIFPLIFLTCNKNDEVEFVSPIFGTIEGTVDLGDGFVVNTRVVLDENGNMEWDIFLKGEDGEYIERYYWPSIIGKDVSDDTSNWLYDNIESSETRRLFYSPAAEASGLYTSVANGITDMPINWNAHYGIMDFDESKTTYELRNVCVPQELQLANDTLCGGWENWELSTPFVGTRVD